MTVEALKEFGLSRKDAVAREEHVRPRPAVVDVRPARPRPPIAFLEQAVRQGARHPRRQHRRASRPAGTSARPPRPSPSSYEIKPGPDAAGHLPQHHRQPRALAYGLVAGGVAVRAAALPRLLPDHAGLRHPPRAAASTSGFGVTTFQAEDEIAGDRRRARRRRSAARSASPPPPGPGIALKSETIGLAVMTELPLVVVDVQRGGPSTGLPTKTEQADLLQAMFGRNGEAPVPIVAPQSPGDCFDAAIEAVRIAVTYRTPVILLSDGYLANGSEPWRIPDVDDLPAIDPDFATEPNHSRRRRTSRTSGPTCATPRPWPARGRSRAPPGSSTASAGSRRATATATSPTTRTTTTDGPHPAGQGRPDRRLAARRSRSTTRPGDADGRSCSAGARRTARSAPACAACPQGRPRAWPRRTCATSTRSRNDLGEVLAPLRPGAGPRDEPRPALAAAARASTSSTSSATTRSAACRSRPPSSPTRSAT